MMSVASITLYLTTLYGTALSSDEEHHWDASWTQEDWDSLFVDADDWCTPSFLQNVLNDPMYPDSCPDGYHDDNALMCYEDCPDGYHDDGALMCWEDCPSGWELVAGVCWQSTLKTLPQGSYERGVGVIPNSCGSGMSMESGLCYQTCRSGYSGFGCHCWRGLDAYGRGCGTIPVNCPSSHPNKQNGLCYKDCPSAYPIAEGPVCWEHCDDYADGVDTGLFCQYGELKSSVPRSYFKASTERQCSKGMRSGVMCYEECGDGFTSVLGVCWNDNFDNSLASVLATAGTIPFLGTCYGIISPILAPLVADYKTGVVPEGLEQLDFDPFLKCAWLQVETLAALDDKWDRDGVTVYVTFAASAKVVLPSISVYGGIAFDFKDKDNVDIYGFEGGCLDVDINVAVGVGFDATVGLFREVSEIDGFKAFFKLGVEVMSMVSVASAWEFDRTCSIGGVASEAGLSAAVGLLPHESLPVEPEIGIGYCINFNRELLGSVSSPAARAGSEDLPVTDTDQEYFVGASAMDQSSAEAYCRENGGHLASMSSEAEFNIAGELCAASGVSACWIGLVSGGGSLDWSWTDGSALDFGFNSDGTATFGSHPWLEGEPNDWGYDEDCVEFQSLFGFGFNDKSCGAELHPICRAAGTSTAGTCDCTLMSGANCAGGGGTSTTGRARSGCTKHETLSACAQFDYGGESWYEENTCRWIPDAETETAAPCTDSTATATARYIHIHMYDNWLNLMEVTAYDASGAAIPAANAVLSTTYSALYPASHCIDGDTSTMCHGGSDSYDWLQIDLGSAKEIKSVFIVNRDNCCRDRIDGAVLSLFCLDDIKCMDIPDSTTQQWIIPADSGTATMNFDVKCTDTEAASSAKQIRSRAVDVEAAKAKLSTQMIRNFEARQPQSYPDAPNDGDNDTMVVLNVSRSALELFVFAVTAVSALLCVGWCFGGFCGRKSAYAKVAMAYVSETDTEENAAINDGDEQL